MSIGVIIGIALIVTAIVGVGVSLTVWVNWEIRQIDTFLDEIERRED